MNWKKLGLIFANDSIHPLLNSHASNPLVYPIGDSIFRIFFSGRNSENKSSVGYVDINLETKEVIYQHTEPIIKFGGANDFCSHGISIGNAYQNLENETCILFMAWQIKGDDHWRGDIGRLKLINNSIMEFFPDASFMTIDNEDKVSLSYPFVIYHENKFKMWYGSTINWETENGEMLHVIKYATSIDGEIWDKHGVAIPYKLGVAQAFSRPSVIIDDDGYHMWFSYRSGTGAKYRIGYAHSKDGITWSLKLNETGIDVSANGWDSEMICYPFVFDHNNKRYMLYNGNEYGKTGIGLAVLER